MLEPGKSFDAEQDGSYLYIPVTAPELKKAISAKFKLVGSW
jgi:hypothetical protein